MDSPSNWNQVAVELRELESAMQQSRSTHRRTSRTALFITLTLSLTIITFVVVNYLTLSSSWAKENFAASLEQELSEFSPVIVEQLNLLGQDLLPIYAQEGRRQVTQLAPQITHRCQEQIDALGVELLSSVKMQMDQNRERVMGEIEVEIARNYPALTNPESMGEIRERFREITERVVLKSIADFELRFNRDVEEVRAALLRLDVSDTDESTVDLQKKFIRLWLQVLDQEIKEL